MKEIIPAVIPHTFFDVKNAAHAVKGEANILHVDVCDGAFTLNPTWPYAKADDFFMRISSEQEGLPAWEEINYDIHLMCNDPAPLIEQWISAGAQRIFFHVEACGPEEIRALMEMSNDFVQIIPAIKADTDISILSPVHDILTHVLVMTIEQVGEQGVELMHNAFERVETIAAIKQDLHVIVDGGINEETIESMSAAGAQSFVIGSAIFHAVNPNAAIREFRGMMRE